MKTLLFVRKSLFFLLAAGCAACGIPAHDHSAETADEHDHPVETAPADADEHDHPGEVGFTRAQAAAAGLEVETVSPAPFAAVIPVGGQLQSPAGDEQTIAAPSSGILYFTDPSLTEGSAVRAGATLASISGETLLDGDPVQRAALNFEAAEREYRRAETLLADTLLSAREFDAIRARYEAARAAWRGQAQRMTARGLAVPVPMNGYLKSRLVGQGEYVSVGQPIAVVGRNRRLQLRADLPEHAFRSLSAIRSAHFRTAYDDTVRRLADLDGRLISTGQAADGAYIPLVFEFENPGDLLPGSFVDVYLLARPREEAITVPLSALTEEQGLRFVYLQLEDEVFKKQEVKVGQNDGSRVEILSGLEPGDRVVTRGAYQVKLAGASAAIPAHTHNH
ncbi:efflux RND transporter periplasmic adaptor subunit [uncultured Rikenella sp.]|uniref:efflux RND transporter periplasmic adaptor subunit n=1 Tax=uncultured Rikenella sp. TaxID=368003 RepID=UPI002639D4CE|nr:efflux RND transporter periplasmic adaptor subunit [uncultured Rikenella sp.]